MSERQFGRGRLLSFALAWVKDNFRKGGGCLPLPVNIMNINKIYEASSKRGGARGMKPPTSPTMVPKSSKWSTCSLGHCCANHKLEIVTLHQNGSISTIFNKIFLNFSQWSTLTGITPVALAIPKKAHFPPISSPQFQAWLWAWLLLARILSSNATRNTLSLQNSFMSLMPQ